MEPAGIQTCNTWESGSTPGAPRSGRVPSFPLPASALRLHKKVEHRAKLKSPTLTPPPPWHPWAGKPAEGKQGHQHVGVLGGKCCQEQLCRPLGWRRAGKAALPRGIPGSLMCNHHWVSLPAPGRGRGGGGGRALASNILILKRQVIYLQGGRTRGGWTRPPCHECAQDMLPPAQERRGQT